MSIASLLSDLQYVNQLLGWFRATESECGIDPILDSTIRTYLGGVLQ